MQKKHFWIIVISLLVFDQILKFYIKLNFYLGEEKMLLGSWFRMKFIENEGMAYGITFFEGPLAKILLTSFRLISVIVGFFIIKNFFKKQYSKLFFVFVALIFAGAIGNLVDSIFYGLIFSDSSPYALVTAELFPKDGGYGALFLGKVVDMIYVPIIRDASYPSWFPFWGGQPFEFFSPIFNVSDTAISTGVIGLWIFQKRIFKDPLETSGLS